ncbi:MAG: type II toxin-antitoxin system RelE/ParE family toxin [Gammaproteobacteria bacterium]|nr:type II toxin-antitoxin system RelE/ParE family toxin [Gammaproteobacteria bacterium]
MNLRILRAAQRDLVEGYWFYEKQKHGLGGHFLNSLYSDIEALLTTAGAHVICFNRYYRLLSRRFPFAIYYRLEQQIVFIYAILDCRRSPAWIRDKLKG